MNKDLYRDTFSQVHSRTAFSPEHAHPSRRGSRRRVLPLVAACLVLLSVTAYAANFWGLHDFLIPVAPPSAELLPVENQEAVLSLQGLATSPESRAAAEWLAFQQSYDVDGALLAAVGNGPTGLSERYSLYSAYTQEMADKLDEIVAKYGLSLHTQWIELFCREDLIGQLGGDFLGSVNTPESAYMYEDGTCHYDGQALLPDGTAFSYQFTRCVQGSFTDIAYYPGDVSAYTQWNYTAPDGTDMVLAIGPSISLLMAAPGKSMITMNIFAGSGEAADTQMTPAMLEEFADSFTLSVLA